MSEAIKNRYEFVYFFDVENGNPNGDPDAGNMPRIDPETGIGLVTDVCLKRKIRNYVELAKNNKPPFQIAVREKAIINKITREKYEEIGIDLTADPLEKSDGKRNEKGVAQGSEILRCQNELHKQYYDIRTFGAVLSTGPNAGQVRGAVQINFAKSLSPIVPLEITLTVCAARKEDAPIKDQIGIQGRKHIVPYGLYRVEGYVSANYAEKTGFTEEDLDLLKEALVNMFDHDHSAARGKMNARKLFFFKHGTALGNAPAHRLFDLIKAEERDTEATPRSFADYVITTDKNGVPSGVELQEVL